MSNGSSVNEGLGRVREGDVLALIWLEFPWRFWEKPQTYSIAISFFQVEI